MRLIKSQYEGILRRAAKYNDPHDLDHDWDRTTKDQRAVMNLALDLEDCRKALALAMPVLVDDLASMLRSFTNDGDRSTMDADMKKWVDITEAALVAVKEALK